MAEESEDELEMLVEYDEEFSDSTTEDEGSEDDGELGEFEDGGDGENAQNDGQNAQNDNEEPAVVDGDAAVAAIIGPYQNEPPPRARERGEQQNYGDARLVDPARLLNRDWYVNFSLCYLENSFEMAKDNQNLRFFPVNSPSSHHGHSTFSMHHYPGHNGLLPLLTLHPNVVFYNDLKLKIDSYLL